MSRTWSIAAGLALVLVLGVGCGSGGANNGKSGPPGGMGAENLDAEEAPGSLPRFPIQYNDVQRISIQRQVDLAGSLISPDQARVSSEVAGVVRKVLVELGRKLARPGGGEAGSAGT